MRGGRLRNCKGRRPRLHDTGLVPSNFFNGFTEHGNVIDTQTRDTGHSWGDNDISAIVFSANAALNDGCVDPFGHVGM